MWKAQVPAKVRHFLWRLGRHSIPTEDVRKTRKMAQSDACQVCGVQDSWRHSLIECSSSHCVWALSENNIVDHLIATTETNAKQWLFTVIATLNHHGLTHVVTKLWAIWHSQRKMLHEDIYQSPLSTHECAGGRHYDSPSEKYTYEIINRVGSTIIRVAGGVLRDRQRGVAAANARDSLGNYLGSSAMIIPRVIDGQCLESLACREAQSLAHDLLI